MALDLEINDKITIDISIPFYINNNNIRKELTIKIFKHYVNLKKFFFNKAIITLTLVGSENEISRDLVLNYFDENEYYEFDQSIYSYDLNKSWNNINFMTMLSDKFKKCYEISMLKKPNISLLAGSNDYICYDFFEQIINSYNNNKNSKYIYGINNYYNGGNIVNFIKYNSNIIDIFDNGKSFFWEGSTIARSQFNYCGGIIGFNDHLYLNNENKIIDIVNLDEGEIEFNLLKLDNVSQFNSTELFYLNIKTDFDLNSFENLLNYPLKQITFDKISDNLKKNIINEIQLFNSL